MRYAHTEKKTNQNVNDCTELTRVAYFPFISLLVIVVVRFIPQIAKQDIKHEYLQSIYRTMQELIDLLYGLGLLYVSNVIYKWYNSSNG